MAGILDWDLSDVVDEIGDEEFGIEGILDDEDADFDDESEDDAFYDTDEDIEEGIEEGPLRPRSRRDLASSLRRLLKGKASDSESYGLGYGHGYLKALVDNGRMSQEQARQAYGNPGIFKLVGAGLGQIAGGVVEGAGFETRGIGKQVGRRLGGALGETGAVPSWLRKQKPKKAETEEAIGPKAPREDASVEAGPEEMPPTFVAEEDEILEESLDEAPEGGVYATEAGEMSESFGASAHHGFSSWLRRPSAKQAAEKAMAYGSMGLKRADLLEPHALIEDTEAEPVLFSDGSIWDPAYGAMAAVPCPSCAQVSYGAAENRAHHACVVCGGHGAILVPASDLGYVKREGYGAGEGFVAALMPALGSSLGSAAGQAAGTAGVALGVERLKAKMKKKAKDKLIKKLKKKLAKKSLKEAQKEAVSETLAEQAATGTPATPEVAKAAVEAAAAEVASPTETEETATEEIKSEVAEVEKMGLLRAIVPERLAKTIGAHIDYDDEDNEDDEDDEDEEYGYDEDEDDDEDFGFLSGTDLFEDDDDDDEV